MFDIGFWELALVAIVALLVVGPERLPGFAREAGRWVRRLRRMAGEARREMERELDWDEERDTGGLRRRLRNLDRLMKEAPDRRPDYKPQYPEHHQPDTAPDSEPGPESGEDPGKRQKPGNDGNG